MGLGGLGHPSDSVISETLATAASGSLATLMRSRRFGGQRLMRRYTFKFAEDNQTFPGAIELLNKI